ncbi:MAG: hypothetical protein ACT452_19190 [Microthrixaceae bacterium]
MLLPGGDVAQRLAGLTSTAATILQDEHWLSGGADRAHLTVRALEHYADVIDPDRLERYQSALRRALRDIGPLRFEFRGLGISPGSLLVPAIPLGPGPDALRERLGTELGADGWLEDRFFDNGRDPIWYCSILHYATSLSNVDNMMNWVENQSDVFLGAHTFDSVEICAWKHDGAGMAPQVAASLPAPGGT